MRGQKNVKLHKGKSLNVSCPSLHNSETIKPELKPIT